MARVIDKMFSSKAVDKAYEVFGNNVAEGAIGPIHDLLLRRFREIEKAHERAYLIESDLLEPELLGMKCGVFMEKLNALLSILIMEVRWWT